VTRLTNDPATDGSPAWSPDGTAIVFVRGGNIYRIDADGSNPTEVFAADSINIDPDWRPLPI
jgi:TolB protein